MTITIPLNKLQLSDANVRKTNADEDIASLAEDIASRGLIQNLVVTADRKKKGHWLVDAGGRRLQALKLLAEQKKIPANQPVSCLEIPGEHALEASLAENLHRVAMNAADECEAFSAIIERYADSGITDPAEQIANCARRFGVTVRHVEQRLRLAALAPEILDALRNSRISLDAAKAYAGTTDHKRQLQVFKAEQIKGQFSHAPQTIRDALKGKSYEANDRRCVYIGQEAYIAAGGRIEADLFMGADDGELWIDPDIVDRLLHAKGGEEAARKAEAEGWAGGLIMPRLDRYYPRPKEPAGYRTKYVGWGAIAPDDQKDAIALYWLAKSGELERADCIFVPIAEPQQPERGNQTGATPTVAGRDMAEQNRLDRIEERAARLAAPRFAGTPFEGRACWPDGETYIDPVMPADDDDHLFVAVLIKVPKAEVDACRNQAEMEVDAEAAEEARRAEEQAAADNSETAPAEPEDAVA